MIVLAPRCAADWFSVKHSSLQDIQETSLQQKRKFRWVISFKLNFITMRNEAFVINVSWFNVRKKFMITCMHERKQFLGSLDLVSFQVSTKTDSFYLWNISIKLHCCVLFQERQTTLEGKTETSWINVQTTKLWAM